MIPAVAPELQGHPRTNQQSRICHEFLFAMPRNRHSRNSVQRSFPSAIVENWNRLPPELITAPLTLPRLQQFKEGVYKYLRSADWHWASIVRGPISKKSHSLEVSWQVGAHNILELFPTKLWLLKTIKVSASLYCCPFVRYGNLPLHTDIVHVLEPSHSRILYM